MRQDGTYIHVHHIHTQDLGSRHMETEITMPLSAESIKRLAKEKWDTKSEELRALSGRKYMPFFARLRLPMNPWELSFDELTEAQRNVIIKGELIRTYDSLPNSEKTKLKELLGLSEFKSKWFRLGSRDKRILLGTIITTKHNNNNDSRKITDAVGRGVPARAKQVQQTDNC